MNDSIRTQIEALDSLRLPELQARYAEVLGEETRCPNKRYLDQESLRELRRLLRDLEDKRRRAVRQARMTPWRLP